MKLPQQLESLHAKLAHENTALKMAWEMELQRAHDAGLPVDAIESLATNSSGPTWFATLANRLALADKNSRGKKPVQPWAEFLHLVDESPHSLAQWIAALERFYDILRKSGRSSNWDMAVGYLHCCAMAESDAPLPDLVEEMIQQHGFLGEHPES